MPRKDILRLCALSVLAGEIAFAQYDLLLKNGHVIDPASEIDRVMDVATAGNKIARVAADIPPAQARKTIDATGLYVTPGLIDLHAHVYVKGDSGSLLPDDSALPAGTTTVVDAGTSGWRTFDDFRRRIIDRAQTRVLAFLNIVGGGITGSDAESDVADMDPKATAAKILEHPQILVGIKTAHFGKPGWGAIQRAVEAGRLSSTPVIVDDRVFTNSGRTTREKVLDQLRPGDLHTHTYNDRQLELIDRFSRKVQPYMLEARRRGVLFDLGHGAGSFLWPVAVAAMQQGFPPDTISTDLHAGSVLIAQSDMPNCISKLIALGMTLPDAIRRSTLNPARAIGRFPELGTMGEGRVADIAVFDLRTGVFAFKDAWGHKLMGTQKLECVLTVRDGKLVYDSGGLGFPAWTAAR